MYFPEVQAGRPRQLMGVLRTIEKGGRETPGALAITWRFKLPPILTCQWNKRLYESLSHYCSFISFFCRNSQSLISRIEKVHRLKRTDQREEWILHHFIVYFGKDKDMRITLPASTSLRRVTHDDKRAIKASHIYKSFTGDTKWLRKRTNQESEVWVRAIECHFLLSQLLVMNREESH